MLEWFGSLEGLDQFFAVCAGLGGVFTLVRLALSLLGGDADVDVDLDVDHGDGTFGLLSLQGLSAFFMMFGLIGLGCHVELQLSPALSIIGGIGAGLLMTLLMARIFDLFHAMQSSGNIDLSNAIGAEGTVYLTVKTKVGGKARVTVQKRLRVLDAVTHDGRDLPTGTAIVVTALESGNVLVVTANQASRA